MNHKETNSVAHSGAQMKLVRDWNKKHPIIVDVIVKRDDNTEFYTQTRSIAWMLEGHTAVIFLKRYAACYALDKIRPVVEVP